MISSRITRKTRIRLTARQGLIIFFTPFERVWRNGSALASQAKGCGFESRRPLQFKDRWQRDR